MALSIKTKDDRAYLLDHEEFGDIAKTTFEQGEIVDFGQETEDPMVLDDTCKVKTEDGKEFDKVPIFYHCKKGFYDEETATKRPSGALTRAAWAFRKGQKVKVMFYEGEPVYVIGHSDSPRKCLDIFKMTHKEWNGRPHTDHIQCSKRDAYCPMDEEAKEPDDKPLLITTKQERIFGQKEGFDVLMLMWFFFGDYLIKVGPIMYILQVWSTGFPIPVTIETRIFAALYDEEQYQAAVDYGKTKEGKFPFYVYFAAQQYYLTNKSEYAGFTLQTDFSNSLKKRYAGTIPVRWIHTELFSQHWPEDDEEGSE